MGAYLGQSVYNDSQVTEEKVEELIEENGKGVFFAEIGTTPYNDVLSAYNDGKTIIGKYATNETYGINTRYYPLLQYVTDSEEGNYFSFGLATGGNSFTYWNLHIQGGWGGKITGPLVIIDEQLNARSHNPVENAAIAAELTLINNKITGDLNDIFLALASKGVTVPAGAGLDDVAGLIDDIETGGGPTPLPDNWITVLGIKKVSNYRDTHFPISLEEYTTNENIIFEFDMKFVDFSSTSQSIRIAGSPPDLYFVNKTPADSIDIYCGNDNGTYDLTRIPNSSVSKPDLNNRFKIEYNRNVGKIYSSNGTFNLNLYYSQKNFISFVLLHNDVEFSSYIFYGLTIKKRDTGEYLLKLIPVKNQTNNDCGFYDIVSGRLFQANHNPESYQAVE